MRRRLRYSLEFRQRAVKMVTDVRSSFATDREALEAVAGILGIDDPNTLRKWYKHARLSGNNDAPNRSTLRKFFSRTHAIIIGTAVTVFGGLALAYSQQFFGLGASVDSSAPDLTVDQVGFSYGTWTDPIPQPFKIDIKLLNTGGQLAVINSARLVIQKVATLQVCACQGDLPSTGTYPASLPIKPMPSRIVTIPISQVVPANGADRFNLLLRAGRLPAAPANIYLYRFHLYLTYNSDNKQLDVGEIVMSYPVAPADGQYFWSKRWAADPHLTDIMMSHNKQAEAAFRKCNINDSHTLHSVLSLPGMRPAELIAIPSQLAY